MKGHLPMTARYIAGQIIFWTLFTAASFITIPPAQGHDEDWMRRALGDNTPVLTRRQARKHSRIEYIPVRKYVPVRHVPEHYERLDTPQWWHQRRWHHRSW